MRITRSSRIRLMAFVVLVCLLLPALALAQTDTPPAAPTLVAFSDPAYNLQGVIPDGWTKAGPGIYVRGSSAGDVTLLALQSAPTDVATIWPALLPQFGLEDVPESSGSYATPAFDWSLYQFDVTAGAVTVRVALALAEQDGSSYIALLQTTPDEYELLYDSVFLPVLDALTLLESTEEPLPYRVEDVTFDNGDITLAGTLTLPEGAGPHPAIILMTGSGAQTRDEQVAPGFPIFRLIADYLTRQGIAVLRYDDRGTGESGGDYSAATVFDLASDGKAAVAYASSRPEIDPDQVGVLGHSEGGLYAAILGADPDSGVAFIISMAGPGVPLSAVLVRQNELIMRAAGSSEEVIALQLEFLDAAIPLIIARDWDAVDQLVVETTLAQLATVSDEDLAAAGITDREAYAQQQADNFRANYANEWFATGLEYDPAPDWAQTTVPVLAVFGELDLQVDPLQNAEPLETAVRSGGNEDVTVVILDGANHLFQQAETGAIQEYAVLPPEFVPDFLPTLSDWLLARVTLPG